MRKNKALFYNGNKINPKNNKCIHQSLLDINRIRKKYIETHDEIDIIFLMELQLINDEIAQFNT